MKNFFTKAFVCAGVLASALALGSMSVMADATPHTYKIEGTSGVDEASRSYFTIAVNTDTGKVTNLDAGGTTVTSGVKMTTNNNITFTVTGEATIDVSFASNVNVGKETDATIQLDGEDVKSGEDVIYSNNRATAATYSGTLSAGEHTISRGSNGKQANVYYLKVVDTFDETAITTYTATLNLANNSDSEATVYCGTNSKTIAANSSDTFEVANLKNGSYTLTADKYHELDDTSLVIEDANVEKNITISAIEIPTLTEGDHNSFTIANGFDETAANTGKYGKNEYVKFTLSKPAIVTITAQIGSNDRNLETAKTAALSYSTTSSYNADNEIFSFSTNDDTKLSGTEEIELPIGTWYFVGKSPANDGENTTTVQVTNINVAYKTSQSYFTPYSVVSYNGDAYIIGSITADDLSKVTSDVGLAGGTTEEKATAKGSPTTTSNYVYRAIKVGETVLAGDLEVEEVDTYYFAVKLTGKGGQSYHFKGFADNVASAIANPAVTVK